VDESDRQASAYFRRSYTAVDGLWFMKVEEALGFERALELDREVWRVMPKIQARWIRAHLDPAALGRGSGLGALQACLSAKLRWEEHAHETRWRDEGRVLEIVIRYCPWRRLLVRSGREALAPRIGETICAAEYAVWASEFGEEIAFTLGPSLCQGADGCVLRFEQRARTP